MRHKTFCNPNANDLEFSSTDLKYAYAAIVLLKFALILLHLLCEVLLNERFMV